MAQDNTITLTVNELNNLLAASKNCNVNVQHDGAGGTIATATVTAATANSNPPLLPMIPQLKPTNELVTPTASTIPIQRPTMTATMKSGAQELKTFDEKVAASIADLQTYPIQNVRLLAKQMGIQGCDVKDDEQICRIVAQKLIYIHSNTIPFVDQGMCSKYTKKLSNSKLKKVRSKIYKKFNGFKDSVSSMTSDDLHKMFQMYDDLCFDNSIQDYITDKEFTLKFALSGEDTFTTEGVCTAKRSDTKAMKCDYVITIPIHFFDLVKGKTLIAGQECNDQLECLQRVMEHELVHLIIFMFCGDEFITNQHGDLFMSTVHDLFRHTDYKHYIF